MLSKIRFALQRRWPLLVVGLLIGLLGAVATRSMGVSNGVSYRSLDIALLNVAEADSAASTVTQDAELVTRGAVPVEAAERLGLAEEADELVKDVTALADTVSFSIEITAVQPTLEEASGLSRAFVDSFVEIRNAEHAAEQQSLVDRAQESADEAEAAITAFDAENPRSPDPAVPLAPGLEEERDRLVSEYTAAFSAASAARAELRGIDLYTAAGSTEPTQLSSLALPDSLPLRLAAFILFSLGATIAVIVFVERNNPRLDTREDVVDLLGVSVIGEIGVLPRSERFGDEGVRLSLDSPAAEPYRRVRSAFQFVLQRGRTPAPSADATPGAAASELTGGSKVFLIASALPNEGKSTTVAMTSMTLAEAGVRTLVLGCDYRKSTIDTMLGVQPTVGISDRAQVSARRPELAEIIYESEENLWVSPSGRPAANFAACTEVVGELVAAAREADISVVIDTTPLAVANDAVDLLPLVDEVVLVVRAGHTEVGAARDVLEQFAQHHREVLGVVLVGSRSSRDRGSYYGSYQEQPASTGLFGR